MSSLWELIQEPSSIGSAGYIYRLNETRTDMMFESFFRIFKPKDRIFFYHF